MDATIDLKWPRADFSRIPFRAYLDPAVYALERERIFRGPVWSYLALEIEIPAANDFKVVEVGDLSVIVTRDANGEISALLNRCAHRGTLLCRHERGNAPSHTCVYHQWRYDLEGRLLSIPFSRGINGRGGLPPDFDRAAIRLQRMRVARYRGVIFGTFSEEAEPLETFLGSAVLGELDRLFHKPIELLGYQRQRIAGNWKLYCDNARDPNHGGLLHMFHATFGLSRNSLKGGARLDPKGCHNISYSMIGKDDEAARQSGYASTQKVFQSDFELLDREMLGYRPEYPDDVSLVVMSVFPNVVFQQIMNSLCTRQIRLRGAGEFELYWTYFGYTDDTPQMRRHRLLQGNLVGPGGYVSMEDGEAVEIVHRAISTQPDAFSIVEIGGKGRIADADTLVTEVPVRGFWAHYHRVMGFDAPGDAA
jgi:anthranilate 1,2-dioxygenase large subunit